MPVSPETLSQALPEQYLGKRLAQKYPPCPFVSNTTLTSSNIYFLSLATNNIRPRIKDLDWFNKLGNFRA